MKKYIFYLTIIILVLCCSISTMPFCAAETNDGKTNNYIVEDIELSYNNYSKQFMDKSYYDAEIININGSDYSKVTNECDLTENGNLLINNNGIIEYTINIPDDAVYTIAFTCRILGENELNLDLFIDGKIPFDEAGRLSFPQYYEQKEIFRTDDLGNQFSVAPNVSEEFHNRLLQDNTGEYTEPFEFFFSKGQHSISLNFSNAKVELAKLTLQPKNVLKSYEEIRNTYKNNNYEICDVEPIRIQGEAAELKTSRSLPGRSDTESASVYPNDFKKTMINYIGFNDWKEPGEELVWSFDVEKSGLYAIGTRFKQDQLVNANSYRVIKIDGVIPFKEAANISFYYDTSWQSNVFGDEDEPFYFYLEEGTHTLSLSVTLGETSEFYRRLKEIVNTIGDTYLNIIMITGETPDPNRDYDLFKQIPNFNEILQNCSSDLNKLAAEMKELTGNNTNQYVGAIQNMTRVLDSMIKNPYSAQDYVSDYYNQYTSLSSWLYEMKNMPLSIDEIQLTGNTQNFKLGNSGFFKSVWFTIRRFLYSFSSEYQTTSTLSNNKEKIKIWVNWGRDQTQVLNNLIRESFLEYSKKELGYEVGVQLEITTATLINGILSNNQPDLALYMARTEPINYAMRGALYDLTNFSDYEDVLMRFNKEAAAPYYYKDGLYALPDSQAFYIMFYRSDILDALGLDIPKTWDDFMDATAVIQRNNMHTYLPTSAPTANDGIGSCGIFGTLLMQDDVEVYSSDRSSSLLDGVSAISTFTKWTDMYTKYKIPTTQSFYNRFRVGLCPLGIDVYTQYILLRTAAPEIEGRWGIANIPATINADGTSNNFVSGMGTGCGILEKSSNKEEAWTFLKWWTSADTQLAYNNHLESILGEVARITTSNREAFSRMTWDLNDLNILDNQFDCVKEFIEIPGGYYVTRAVDQAYWEVINGSSDNAKDALVEWNLIANREIKRKIKEYERNDK